jgi:hypothetical protein
MCIIIFKKIDTQNYIAKNRDKSITTNISIIHELLDNIEIVYMFDVDTYWVEGMNEFGIGIVNSTLAVKTDEVRDEYQKRLYTKKRNMLKNNKLEKMSEEWLLFSKNSDLYNGHTILSSSKQCIHIESCHGEIPIIEKIFMDSVYTNHSMHLNNKGYSYGKKYLSSLLRKELAYNEIIKINNKNEIFNCLNKNYIDLNPEFHTYRNKKHTLSYLNEDDKYIAFNTGCQMLMCLSELIFYFNYDSENCNFIKYDNRLPYHYTPKIKVNILKISKSKKAEKMPFDQNHIDTIIENKMYKKKNILFYCLVLILACYIYIRFFEK